MLEPQKMFNITKHEIHAKYKCSTEVNFRDYNDDTIIETSKFIEMPGILQFWSPDLNDFSQIVINYRVNLNKTTSISTEKELMTINYEPGDLVLYKDYYVDETDMGMLIRLFHGRIKYVKDPKILINMLFKNLPAIDLVHLETIVSNMFRDSNNLSDLTRWTGNYKNSTILGQSKQPYNDSWFNALLFMYIDKAIKAGLIDGKPARRDPIELVASENFNEL